MYVRADGCLDGGDLPVDVVIHLQSRMRIWRRDLSWSYRFSIAIEAAVRACVVIIRQQGLLLFPTLCST
jgi:hypothetical protein